MTVGHPSQPELEITLMTPGPPLDEDAAAFIRRQLEKGGMGGLGLHVDDCRKTFEELSANGEIGQTHTLVGMVPTGRAPRLRMRAATTPFPGWTFAL